MSSFDSGELFVFAISQILMTWRPENTVCQVNESLQDDTGTEVSLNCTGHLSF